VKATITLQEGSTFEGVAGSGHRVTMDVAPEVGGRNLGLRPMEMVLLGLGGCTAIDVLHMLRKGRQPITDMRVELDAERADDVPKVFTRIHVHFVLTGAGLDPHKIERAIKLSATKYCSASMMLNKTAEMTHDFEIVEQ
jgi:putative redox protein